MSFLFLICYSMHLRAVRSITNQSVCYKSHLCAVNLQQTESCDALQGTLAHSEPSNKLHSRFQSYRVHLNSTLARVSAFFKFTYELLYVLVLFRVAFIDDVLQVGLQSGLPPRGAAWVMLNRPPQIKRTNDQSANLIIRLFDQWFFGKFVPGAPARLH